MIIIILSCNYWNRMGDMVLHIFSPLKVCVWRERLGLCAGQVEPQKRRIFFARSLSLSEFNLDEIKKNMTHGKKRESPLLAIISKQPLLVIDKWQGLRANIVIKDMVQWKWNLPNEIKLSPPYYHPTRPTTLPWERFPDVIFERNSALTYS